MQDRPVFAGESFVPDKLSGSSGLAKAFPSLDAPTYVTAAEATHTRPDDEIVGVVYHGRARAYPLWVARHFHIVNDQWGDKRLLVDT
jgi:hypothetical protein